MIWKTVGAPNQNIDQQLEKESSALLRETICILFPETNRKNSVSLISIPPA